LLYVRHYEASSYSHTGDCMGRPLDGFLDHAVCVDVVLLELEYIIEFFSFCLFRVSEESCWKIKCEGVSW
jgi:hypothetical protein